MKVRRGEIYVPMDCDDSTIIDGDTAVSIGELDRSRNLIVGYATIGHKTPATYSNLLMTYTPEKEFLAKMKKTTLKQLEGLLIEVAREWNVNLEDFFKRTFSSEKQLYREYSAKILNLVGHV